MAVEQPDKREPRGLVCPDCGCRHFNVVYTRPRPKGMIVRRRECRYCGRRITTCETGKNGPELH